MAFSSTERAPAGYHAVPGTLSLLSVAAAAIHFAVLGDHFNEYWAFGAFFLVTAWFQAAWAVLVVVHASRALLLIGAIANAAVVVVWLWSRTAGLPIGPEAGEPEAAQFTDVVATAAEVLLVAGCVALLRSWRFLGKLSALAEASVFVVAALLTVGTTSWALVISAGETGHLGVTDEHADEEHDGDEGEGLGSTEIRTVSLAEGAELQAFVSGIAPGKSQLDLTFLDEHGDELRVASLTIHATSAGGEERELEATRLSPGHFASSSVPPGEWTFEVAATSEDGIDLATEFTEHVES